jgi:hypothetical protein
MTQSWSESTRGRLINNVVGFPHELLVDFAEFLFQFGDQRGNALLG